MNRYDLLVAGGGPAGTAAAITAAALGGRVLLLERGHFPRQKVCGEFVSAEAVQLLWRLLPPWQQGELACAPRTSEARLFIDSSVVKFPVPPAASIKRTDLDFSLWQTAESSRRVECRQNVSVEKVSLVDDIFEVTTSAGMFSVRAVIDATGRWSKLRPAHRPNGNGQSWIGLKAHFHSTGKMSNDYTTDLYFFEGGYCGVQPLGGGLVNVCAMVRTGAARQIADVFPLHPALQSRSTDWTPATESYAVAPLTFSPPVPAQNGILRAGDAASFIDPFVGDGISLALRSGTLAGDAVSRVWRNNVTCAQAAQIYENEYKARFSRALRTARSLRKLLSGPVATRRISVLLMRVPGVPQYVVRHTR